MPVSARRGVPACIRALLCLRVGGCLHVNPGVSVCVSLLRNSFLASNEALGISSCVHGSVAQKPSSWAGSPPGRGCGLG